MALYQPDISALLCGAFLSSCKIFLLHFLSNELSLKSLALNLNGHVNMLCVVVVVAKRAASRW
jgi:hypothetical protein